MAKSAIVLLFSLLVFSALTAKTCDPNVDPHSRGVDPLNLHVCLCVQNYIFRQSIYTCVLNCNLITQAKSNCLQPYENIDKCACNAGYSWDPLAGVCGRICSSDLNSLGTYSSTNIQECACKQTFKWDPSSQKCIKNCPADQTKHITGISETDITVCACQPGYVFDGLNNICYLPCNEDVHADQNNACACIKGYVKDANNLCVRECINSVSTTATTSETNTNQCVCQPGYKWSDDASLPDRCIVDCSTLENSSKKNPTELTCACDFGFKFQDSTASPPNVCGRDCAVDTHATIINPKAPGQCLCKKGYDWSLTGYPDQCSRDCSTDPHSTTANSISTCACQPEYIWQGGLTPPACGRDCSAATNSPKTTNTTDVAACNCNEGFVWSADQSLPNQCILDCKANTITNALGTNNDAKSCICNSGFNWEPLYTNCARDCTGFAHSQTQTYDPENIAQCRCDEGFYWSAQTGYQNLCIRKCAGLPNTLATRVNADQCNCAPNYKWNTQNTQCERDCSLDRYSTGKLKDGNINVCDCKPGFDWSPDGPYVNKCLKDCSANVVTHSDGSHTAVDACHCEAGYTWEAAAGTYKDTCVRDCANTANSNTKYNPQNSQACTCLEGYTWNGDKLTCDSNCGTAFIPNSVATVCDYPLACSCDDNYSWDQPTLACTFNCPQKSSWNSNTKACDCVGGSVWNSGHTACNCDVGYKWDTSQCVVDPLYIPYCGDGKINQGSQNCDDGNSLNGDGCSNTCSIQAHWECTSEKPGFISTCKYVPYCGDGIINQEIQKCDDGNNIDFDGCSATCEVVQTCIIDLEGKKYCYWDCNAIYYEKNTQAQIRDMQLPQNINVNRLWCNDLNSRPGDGCTKCQIDTTYSCYSQLSFGYWTFQYGYLQHYRQSYCTNCLPNLYATSDFYTNKCPAITTPICGDHIISQGEQCQDIFGCINCKYILKNMNYNLTKLAQQINNQINAINSPNSVVYTSQDVLAGYDQIYRIPALKQINTIYKIISMHRFSPISNQYFAPLQYYYKYQTISISNNLGFHNFTMTQVKYFMESNNCSISTDKQMFDSMKLFGNLLLCSYNVYSLQNGQPALKYDNSVPLMKQFVQNVLNPAFMQIYDKLRIPNSQFTKIFPNRTQFNLNVADKVWETQGKTESQFMKTQLVNTLTKYLIFLDNII